MVCCLVFELTGALTVGARTASTIKGGIIPIEAFEGNAGVQLLAFACAAAGASIWVMWCTRHSAHVSSTYSLVSSIAGVGVATVGAKGVQWGWNEGSGKFPFDNDFLTMSFDADCERLGLGAIFAGLAMAPVASGCFGAIIFVSTTYTRNQTPQNSSLTSISHSLSSKSSSTSDPTPSPGPSGPLPSSSSSPAQSAPSPSSTRAPPVSA